MSNEPMNLEELKSLTQRVGKQLREEMRKELSPMQKAFLSDPSLTEELNHYVLIEHGSRAYLAPCGETIQLSMIETDESERGKGQARTLLRRACTLADQYGVSLSLLAKPEDSKIGLTQEELVDWYKRAGFEGDWNRMTRLPRDMNDDA